MANKEILKILVGFRKFREKYFFQENTVYSRLSTGGQSPKTLFIGCSDSRVDPAIVANASPGDLFVVRNVANLVPPYEEGGMFHGVSAAIEFAVVNLRVENIIIMGHRQCGGIRALMTAPQVEGDKSFVNRWVRIADKARERVLAKYPQADEESLCKHCEMESIVESLANLKTFPFVRQALAEGRLELHGAYFNLESGELFEYNEATGGFKNLEI